MRRAAGPDWPHVLCPDADAYPLAADAWETERLLHVALRDAREPQAALERALRSIASQYVQVDWQAEERKGGVAADQADYALWLLRALHNVTEQAALCDQVKATEGLPGSLKVRAACTYVCLHACCGGVLCHRNRPGRGDTWRGPIQGLAARGLRPCGPAAPHPSTSACHACMLLCLACRRRLARRRRCCTRTTPAGRLSWTPTCTTTTT
jgi:hypothetical protein